MKKYEEPEIMLVSFDVTDRTNTGFGPGDGNDPGDPGSGGGDYSDPVNGVWNTIVW